MKETKDSSNESTEFSHDENKIEEFDRHSVDVENRLAFKGDDSDGNVAWNFRAAFAAACLCGLYTGSQIPLYFMGGSLSYVAADVGGASKSSWLPVSNTLAIAAVAPFSGYLQDLIGRRNITLVGGLILIVGIILVGTAHRFGQAVTGMTLAGAGAGIAELTALAGLSEIVPVNKRGYSLALMTAFVVPFTPYVLYSQLLSTRATWRWGMWISVIYNGICFTGLAFTYFPKSHHRSMGMSRKEILARIDYVGGVLSIVGFTLFLVALQAGGYTHPWKSAYVLCTLIVGILLIISFIIWEWKGAKHPMIPHELFAGQRIVALAYVVAFVSGMNFYSLLNFFPLSFETMYDPDPIQVGLKGLGYGISVTAGAIFFNGMLSFTKGHNRELLLTAAVIMTAFGGSLATLTPENPKTAVALGTIAGFGVGGVLVPAATIAITVTPDALIATAAALSLSIRVIGGSIGYSIYFNVFSNKLTTNLPSSVASYAIKAGLPASSATKFVGTFLTAPANISRVAGATESVVAAAALGVRWAYADSLKWVWYVSIVFGGLAVLACAFLGSTKRYMTNRIAVEIAH